MKSGLWLSQPGCQPGPFAIGAYSTTEDSGCKMCPAGWFFPGLARSGRWPRSIRAAPGLRSSPILKPPNTFAVLQPRPLFLVSLGALRRSIIASKFLVL